MQETHNQNAVVLVCTNEDESIMNMLLNVRADPHITYTKGHTFLYNAVHKHVSKKTLQIIINHCADVNAVNNEGPAALMDACETEQRESMNVVLKAGAKTSIFYVHGEMCTHKLFHRQCEQDTLFLNHGVPLNVRNKNHQTAYKLACHQVNTDAMCVPLNAGSDQSITSDDDSDADLHHINTRCSPCHKTELTYQWCVAALQASNFVIGIDFCETAQHKSLSKLSKA